MLDNIPMDLQQDQHCVVCYLYRCKHTARECYSSIKETYDDNVLAHQMVFTQHKCFKTSRQTAVVQPSPADM